MMWPPRSSTTVVRMVGTSNSLAPFASAVTLLTTRVASMLRMPANWAPWWSISSSTDFSGVRRASRPVYVMPLAAMNSPMVVE